MQAKHYITTAASTLLGMLMFSASFAAPRLNEIQFIGSHNSYKKAMSPVYAAALNATNSDAAITLDYAHLPIGAQLDLGIRKLELDLFNVGAEADFVVGHVQVIDMNSHCEELRVCLRLIRAWSKTRPRHVPIWIGFNLKDEAISGLPDPMAFDGDALDRLDQTLREELGDAFLQPGTVGPGRWPSVDDVRGRFLLVLDHSDHKRDLYAKTWQKRPMFVTVEPEHPAAAVMVINDPLEEFDRIREMVAAGFLVRTRADADTHEARKGDTKRRDKALESGAHAISTDYYVPATHFGTDYLVDPALGVRCNPVTTQQACRIQE